MKNLWNVLRWFLTLPAGLLGMAMVSIPIHLAVMASCGGWGQDSMIKITDGATLASIERFAQSLFSTGVFIFAGAMTAPSRRIAVSIVLACMMVLGVPLLFLWARTLPEGENLAWSPWQIPLLIIGAAVGLYLVYRKVRDQTTRDTVATEI